MRVEISTASFFFLFGPRPPWSVNIDPAEALSIDEHRPSSGGINLRASLIGRPCGRFLGALSASHSHEVPYASPYVPPVEEAQEQLLCGEALLAMSPDLLSGCQHLVAGLLEGHGTAYSGCSRFRSGAEAKA